MLLRRLAARAHHRGAAALGSSVKPLFVSSGADTASCRVVDAAALAPNDFVEAAADLFRKCRMVVLRNATDPERPSCEEHDASARGRTN